LKITGREAEPGEGRGQRQDLAELEGVLLGHEGVREAVVLELEGAQTGRGLVAYVVQSSSGSQPAEGFIAQLKGYLRGQPRFCAVPQEWMILQSLPRTSDGAVDRRALPAPEGFSAGYEYVAPCTELQRALVEIWQERLGIERVGVEDNYFALGGDSIRSVSLVAEAQKRGVHFSVKDVFAYPTVAGLASALERGEARGGEVSEEIAPFALLRDSEREGLRRHMTWRRWRTLIHCR